MILRYFYYFKHSLDRMSDAFYWPTMDLLLWGLTSAFFRQTSSVGSSKIIMIVISGILFWIIVWRGQYEITVNTLEEIWNKNLINIFSSPIKLGEWVLSLLAIGVFKAALSLSFASLVAFILYRINFFQFGFYIIPFGLMLIITGWWVGFFLAGLVLRYGTKIQSFAWGGIMLISPFSAISYPLSILPDWAQKVAMFVPTSYIFEGIREVIDKGSLDWNKILASFILNIFYLVISVFWFKKSFEKILDKGLVKVF